MSSAERPQTPFHLTGNYAPIFDEFTEFDLQVTGEIPAALNGRFFRNGSNPKSGWSPHWFLGNGMVHGVELREGQAVSYRNRYVVTPLLEDANASRVDEDGNFTHTTSCANTHVIEHAGRILALEEGSFPYEITKELETVGPHDFDGKLRTAMTAHPRTCPETGELLFFGTGQMPPYLTYHRVSADGRLVQSEAIEVPGATMMHDWNVTRNHVVFMDLPIILDPAGMAQTGMPIRWAPEYGARLGVMPRDGNNDDVRWIEIDPCFVFHPMNAYEDGDDIVLDVAKIQTASMSPDEPGTPPVLHRWTIRGDGSFHDEPIDDRPADFPRVADAAVGLKHRYGYMCQMGGGADAIGTQLYKYDFATGGSVTHRFAPGCQAGEPVFAADPDGSAEDDGWILDFVYDESRDSSDLVIIDARDFGAAPVARVEMPTRVPFGFHGSWLPE